MSIAITRGFCSLLAVLLLPVAAVAQSTFDTGGFTFRNDVETPASTGSGNQDFVFRGDMEQQQAVQESGSGPKSNAMGNYRFRAPRKQRTLSPTYNPGRDACVEPGYQYRGYQRPQVQHGYQGYQGYQAYPTYPAYQPTPVAPLPYSGQSPYLVPGYQGSYMNPGNYMPGYNSYSPGGYVPSW
ncbi:hypothetical protein [Solemya velum gill symbiont]|uniref:Uncharacterized protein n=1 Tax=Solemya velum gill symbiont TaxID=2340 RepID=A0A1T2DXQ5_SOVGS|nr:hypothetical protein [Solemya velum gill symbiont]OOY35075.1 hypothetical protein BOV88_07080 [Solemya velum gill symbiont]OOY37777.1 hypothetical protein BOV89_05990 [Solemya velum gill symbiont]OOY40560.1 hypothetical protein BOV90_03225 [Solemya velum gill symbiont]OOY47898.1 hypothetical protein BOV92_00565 [Solemya velum gill symbiont]OOY48381.1 hypothetical protein BOV93_03545 [Solemya velum gill symbiont]